MTVAELKRRLDIYNQDAEVEIILPETIDRKNIASMSNVKTASIFDVKSAIGINKETIIVLISKFHHGIVKCD